MSIGVLIILIAMINFVNFSTSLIPTRIRSINVQKVLGGSNAAIRRNMIAESAGLAVVSFFVALLIVHAFSGTPLASDISAPCDVGADMPILWGTALIAVATGIPVRNIPGFLQHLVRSGARSERRFRAYPERTPFAHGTDIGTVRDIDHIDHRHAVDTRTKPLHAKNPIWGSNVKIS